MKILSWNVCGLRQPRTIRRLKNKVRHLQPKIWFLLETKVNAIRMASIRKQCGFHNGIEVDAVGSKGGLLLGWKQDCDVQLYRYSQSHIDVKIMEESDGKIWRLTKFYGSPEEPRKKESWNLLRHLRTSNSHPWLVVGDFNEILFSFEKKGGQLREERQMVEFR